MELGEADGVFHGLVPHFAVHEVEEQDAVLVFLNQSFELGVLVLQMGVGVVHHGFVTEVLIQLVAVGGWRDVFLCGHVGLDVGHEVAHFGRVVLQAEQGGVHVDFGGFVGVAEDAAVDGG